VHAEDEGWQGMPASAMLRVPPLGALWLRPEPAGRAGDLPASPEGDQAAPAPPTEEA
jgi:1,4-alpha-glucan branching enzyme